MTLGLVLAVTAALSPLSAAAPAAVTVAACAAAPAAIPAHPNSFSSSSVRVRGAEVVLHLRVQSASLLEVVEADTDGDGLLSLPELETARAEVAGYVAHHYVLRADGGGDVTAGTVLQGELVSVSVDEALPGLSAVDQWIELTVEHRAATPLRDLAFEVTLFLDTSPDHRDLCRVSWNEEPELETLFHATKPTAYYAPSGEGMAVVSGAGTGAGAMGGLGADGRLGLGSWVRMGADHILGGWDHLAFVIALIVSAGRIGALIWVMTAFTLAHSITLAFAALEIVNIPARPVELLIAFSIAWVGVAALRARAPVSRWPEALLFGLVHGLGFAGFLGQALAGEERRLVPLLGFNLGVEAGQLAVVALAVVPLLLLRGLSVHRARARGAPPPTHAAWLAPPAVRVTVAAIVTLAGCYWFIQRVGWA
ncbi:MAG: HupE/UreJ family protein [Planctomycetota bacterium]